MPIEDHEPESLEKKVLICQNSTCVERGSAKVLRAFETADLPHDITVEGAECQGQCSSGPTVRIVPEETWYCLVQPEDVNTIVTQDLKGGQKLEEKLNPRIHIRFVY